MGQSFLSFIFGCRCGQVSGAYDRWKSCPAEGLAIDVLGCRPSMTRNTRRQTLALAAAWPLVTLTRGAAGAAAPAPGEGGSPRAKNVVPSARGLAIAKGSKVVMMGDS